MWYTTLVQNHQQQLSGNERLTVLDFGEEASSDEMFSWLLLLLMNDT